jgi:hypothetical protein
MEYLVDGHRGSWPFLDRSANLLRLSDAPGYQPVGRKCLGVASRSPGLFWSIVNV